MNELEQLNSNITVLKQWIDVNTQDINTLKEDVMKVKNVEVVDVQVPQGAKETTTTMVNNGDGTYTYTNEEGDTQVVVIPDDKVTLINDLTTGGTTQALTAEQGVVLKGMIDNISLTPGETGEQGIQGIQGEQGVAGADGADGEQGIQGEAGVAGLQGEQGEAGNDGQDGADGSDGIQGVQGETGLKGDTGNDGADGVQGIAGVDGQDGATGPQGIQGEAGADGDSAYQIAVDGGFVGTESEWLISLNGTDGLDGADGIQGIQGIQGEAGADGADGIQGIQGIQGEAGADGTNGVDGANGVDGIQGIQGEAGADGTNGVDGVDGADGADGGGVTNDADPQTNLSATAVVGDLAYDTTDNELQVFDGTNFVNPAESEAQASATAAIASGSTLGLEQGLLAKAGQPGLTVLAVGNTTSGKVQGTSLGDGNVVEVYANGADYNNGVVLYREFMSLGEPICFTGLANGAIISSSQGFYGFSEQLIGSFESPMPLLSYGLSFSFTFMYAFRGSTVAEGGEVYVVNGPLANVIKFTDGDGVTQLSQENIELAPWEHYTLTTNGNKEYIISGTNPMMACTTAHLISGGNDFADSRLIMPLTNDGITWPRSGFVSAPYDNTQVEFFTRDNTEGFINSTAGTGVSPGSPVDFDAAIGVGTGASDTDYEPDGATRVLATGLISAYSGADSSGYEASPLMPTSAMSQVVAQPLTIDDSGDGGNSGVAIASPFEGTARVYSWNDTTKSLDLEYTVPLNRNGVTVTSKEDQKHPAAGLVANETSTGSVALVGQLNPGVVIADVPVTVVVQNATPTLVPSVRSQNGTTTTGIINDDDETLSLGITPPSLKAEITEGADGILYKRSITGGTETWSVA